MQIDYQIWILMIFVFISVSAFASFLGSYFEKYRRVQTRLSTAPSAREGARRSREALGSAVIGRIRSTFVRAEDNEGRSRLRADLIRAGYFSQDAAIVYVTIKAFLMFSVPFAAFFLIGLLWPSASLMQEALVLIAACYGGYLAPDIYVARRRAALLLKYRQLFPDFLDLLVVCISAGLSLNAALDRVTGELTYQCKPMADNLAIFLSEMRTGRPLAEALNNFSERLGLQEAKSFSTLVKQSQELGADIADTLRVYSDEMRGRRLLRAEAAANELPVKMLFPLGVFIFPAIMIIVLAPALMRLVSTLGHMLELAK